MLDTKRLGIKLASLRKRAGYTQEKLADMLRISPQAISKWENGHALPETSLLPVLAQLFGCMIDDIFMPAYSFDERIEQKKGDALEYQAEYIADQILQRIEGKTMKNNDRGLDDDTIIAAISGAHPNIGHCEVVRGKTMKTGRYTSTNVTVTAPQTECKLIERVYAKDDAELRNCCLVRDYTLAAPQIYHIDMGKRIILAEDLNENYVQGFHFNEDTDNGVFVRENHGALLSAAAKFHAAFWEQGAAFERIGLDWRLENRENLLAHINGMEKDYNKYRADEESGKIPKVWNIFENHIDITKLDHFQTALDFLRGEYVELIEKRFNTSKNITIIHGDLHPGNTFISKASDRAVKLIDMQGVRIGLCTEDLAMLLALHIEPEKQAALPLLDGYYRRLCESVDGYPHDMFLNDYKISVAENMFFPLRLINRGIFDFSMRDRAIQAFETFVLDEKYH